VRARLARDLAGVAAGRRWLTEVLLDDNGADEVRAAAAWALGTVDEPAARQALAFARRATHPAVAANAAAALARPRQARPVSPVSVTTVALRDQAGRPVAGRWLRFAVGDGSEVWARTGAAGQASVSGLPGGSATTTVTAAELGAQLLLHDPSDGIGQIARQ
jgi:HEAT repeat protein